MRLQFQSNTGVMTKEKGMMYDEGRAHDRRIQFTIIYNTKNHRI